MGPRTEGHASPHPLLWVITMVVGFFAQAFMLFVSWPMVLFQSDNWRPWVALITMIVGLVLILVVGQRHRWTPLAIPVVSFLVMMVLFQ